MIIEYFPRRLKGNRLDRYGSFLATRFPHNTERDFDLSPILMHFLCHFHGFQPSSTSRFVQIHPSLQTPSSYALHNLHFRLLIPFPHNNWGFFEVGLYLSFSLVEFLNLLWMEFHGLPLWRFNRVPFCFLATKP